MITNSDPKLNRAESSRINGAKSNGPRTDQGKARSSLNRTTHGIRSSRVVLHTESQDLYDKLLQLFFLLFLPRDVFEDECVTNMVNARWRIRRLEAAETAHISLAIEEARPEFEKKFDNLTVDHEYALAFRAIAKSCGEAGLLGRYEDRQHRIFSRSYLLLCKHRGKNSPLPSADAIRQAEEETIPLGNIHRDDPTPSQTEPEPSPEAFEPEPPPPPVDPVRLKPQHLAETSSHSAREPIISYEEEYKALQPIMEALEDRPELRIALSEAIIEHRSKPRNGQPGIELPPWMSRNAPNPRS